MFCFRSLTYMIKDFINKLNEPFPARQGVKQNRIDTAYVSLFVAGFLYFFNPFRLEIMPMGLELAALGFGLVTYICSLSFEWFMQSVIRIRTDLPSWTLWKWILFTAGLVCWIAIGNFTFLVLSIPEAFGWSHFVGMLRGTLMVGITPIIISGMLIQIRATQVNQKDAHQIESFAKHQSAKENENVSEASDNLVIDLEVGSGSSLNLTVESIRAVEAMQNYVMVYHYDSKADQIKESIIRSTLAAVADQLEKSSVIRCHRSFLVNLEHVDKVEGNAQGLKLTLRKMGRKTIPVSRSYISTVKEALR